MRRHSASPVRFAASRSSSRRSIRRHA
jgi:hypothetical protein